jgi:hypothetical protein
MADQHSFHYKQPQESLHLLFLCFYERPQFLERLPDQQLGLIVQRLQRAQARVTWLRVERGFQRL